MMSKFMVEKWEKMRQNGSCAVERARMRQSKGDEEPDNMGRLLATSGHGDLWAPGCCFGSGSMVLSQLGSVLTSMAHVVTKAMRMPSVTCGYAGVGGQCCREDLANLSDLH